MCHIVCVCDVVLTVCVCHVVLTVYVCVCVSVCVGSYHTGRTHSARVQRKVSCSVGGGGEYIMAAF